MTVTHEDCKRFGKLTELLTTDDVDPRVSRAVVNLCDAIARMTSPAKPGSFEQVRAELSCAALDMDRRMSWHLTRGQLCESRKVRPACIADLKLGHADLQVRICNAFREKAIDIRNKHRWVSLKV